MTQYSLFGAAAAVPCLADLDGLLLAGGQWVRSPAGARVSVVVADRWRAGALSATFAELGLDAADPVVATPSGFGVRTAFAPGLIECAARWTSGARQVAPPDLVLSAGGLRLWALAAGHRDGAAYLLRSAPIDDPLHRTAGAQLARLGIAAGSVSVPAARPASRSGAWRVTSTRRLRRLAELLGDAPPGGADDWPALAPVTGRPSAAR